MPTSSDVFEITNPELLERIQGINNGTIKDIVISGQSTEIASTVTDTLSGGELATIIDGNYEVPINDGTVNFMHYEGTGFVDSPVTSTTAIQRSTPAGPISQYNSNVTAIQRGRVVQPYNASVNNGKVTLSSKPSIGGLGANAAYFLGEVNQAVCAVQAGIMLGKTFDSILYNANPDFWDKIGMSSLNPETWGSITHGDDSLNAAFLNMIFGIDPDTNKGQAYIDQNAFAYMAKYMYDNGVFGTGEIEPDFTTPSVNDEIDVESMLIRGTAYDLCNMIGLTINWDGYYPSRYKDYPAIIVWFTIAGQSHPAVAINNQGRYLDVVSQTNTVTEVSVSLGYAKLSSPVFDNSITTVFYYGEPNYPAGVSWGQNPSIAIAQNSSGLINFTYNPPIEGIGTQEGATVPDTTGWDTLADVLDSLQNQYPNIFNDSITYNQIQPDGTLKPTTYVPVGFPNTAANPWTDTKPTTTNQTTTQTNPKIDLDDLPDTETSPLTRTLTKTPTQNPNPDTDVPQNPTDTGSGDGPVPIPPVGSASALWSVYHPTQGQIDSFGAWLWGSPFLTNIGKLFQNPIEGVISLHKVFATPVDSGTGNIVVGTLNSGVSSATVAAQYVEVDCGSVTLDEDFGNVFDYDPYTKVALYLPFVGIVPLNVADVMRSTINVKYGVDLFTGACIAMVSVSRDGNEATLYQYTGNCAVHYPLSNVQQSQLLSGLITVATGIGSIVATGGAAAPAAIPGIATGALSLFQSNVGRSGGFSANAGAMGIKIPYLIIERPQTKVAETFPRLIGYPTNYSVKLGDCSNHVVVKHVHVEGIGATENELEQIESLLKTGVLV